MSSTFDKDCVFREVRYVYNFGKPGTLVRQLCATKADEDGYVRLHLDDETGAHITAFLGIDEFYELRDALNFFIEELNKESNK